MEQGRTYMSATRFVVLLYAARDGRKASHTTMLEDAQWVTFWTRGQYPAAPP